MYAFFILSILLSISLVTAAPANSSAKSVGFAADPSIDAAGIFRAAKAARKNLLATYPSKHESRNNVQIFGDWRRLDGVSAMHFIADMDVDCDGVDFRCPHNPDGQPQTSFGRLSAKRVPYYVIPVRFFEQHRSEIKPNSLGAIICDGSMFYAIFGDQDGDTPQEIGEASILLAQTCFPDEGLDGGTGHDDLDVLYIMFGQDVPKGVGQQTIDIGALKKLGDQQASKLADALGL